MGDAGLRNLVSDHVEALRREGELLAEVADTTSLDVDVPSCPGWRLRDLVRHLCAVHAWAEVHVREQRAERMPAVERDAIVDGCPQDDAELRGWFRTGHAALVDTLLAADPASCCYHFLTAPSGTVFWARRQAHETAIHRADAESPTATFTAYPAAFATDGIDELLYGFAARGDREVRDPDRTLGVRATDADRTWLVGMSSDAMQVSDDPADADCTVAGRASDLYLLLWNRLGRDAVEVAGDESVLDHWRRALQVRWG